MTLFLFIKQAFSSIFGNKLRSFLSTLGIMIGISSFVIMLAIGEGAKKSMLEGLGDTGNVLTLSKNNISESTDLIFSENMRKKLSEKIPHIEKILTKYTPPSWEVRYNGKVVSGDIKISGNGDLKYQGAKIAYGSDFSESDYKNTKKFILLGSDLIKTSDFHSDNPFSCKIPIGETVTLGGNKYIVKGILEEKGWDFDYSIFLTDAVYLKNISTPDIGSFKIYADNTNEVDTIKENIKYFLQKNNIPTNAYEIQTNKEAMKTFNEMAHTFSLLLGGIGAIALIVGGIGIMNIMVVSVTERTREIGIRKAIGATNKNILVQFLIESIILTLFGSGVAIGFSFAIVEILKNTISDFTPIINTSVLITAIIVSVSMGIIFGLMPAYKAARLKPIEALHFE